MTIIALTLAALLPVQQAEADYKKLNDEFLERETQVASAIQLNKEADLKAFLAPDFALVASVLDRPTVVFNYSEWTKAGSYYTLEHFQIKELTAQMFGNTAVVHLRMIRTAKLGTKTDNSGEFVIVDLWRQKGVTWQLARRFLSRPFPLGPGE